VIGRLNNKTIESISKEQSQTLISFVLESQSQNVFILGRYLPAVNRLTWPKIIISVYIFQMEVKRIVISIVIIWISTGAIESNAPIVFVPGPSR